MRSYRQWDEVVEVAGLVDTMPFLGKVVAPVLVIVHHAKDRRTGWFFQIGEREHFVFSRLDGRRTLADIGDEYAARFRRRLGDAQWGQLLGMLAQRRLLVGTDDETAMQAIAAAARRQSQGVRKITYARLPLLDPDRFYTAVGPWLRFLFSRVFVIPALFAVIALEALVLMRIPELYGEVRGVWGFPALGVLALLVVWGSLALHEAAHGLTCAHFGGQVREIGVMWRFPLLAPYCKADDVVLFTNRWHRVYTAFAGVFASLIVLLPFGLLHLLTATGSPAHLFAGAVLFMGSSSALLNLVPFLQLDGYFMLNHSLDMVNLRVESYRYGLLLIRRFFGRDKGEPAPEY